MKKIFYGLSFIAALTFMSFTLQNVTNNYKINKSASIVQFKISDILGTAGVGYFDPPKGIIQFDKSYPDNSKFRVSINVKSINTNNKLRDKDLLSERFFNAEKYPEMSFYSRSIIKTSDGFEVKGTIKIKNISKDISIPFKYIENGNDAYFESEFRLYRLDFGVGDDTKTISNDVLVRLKIAADKKTA
jgi:polyisoprenoid-binding protein YceI